MKSSEIFNKEGLLHELKHHLPSQAPLKDFIHHNTLHGLQHLKFSEATILAERVFGYQTLESISWYKQQLSIGRIDQDLLDETFHSNHRSSPDYGIPDSKLHSEPDPRIGKLRLAWRNQRGVDLNQAVHPVLFRLLGAYLDQGIATWKFPFVHRDFINSVIELERNAQVSIFRTKHCRKLLLSHEFKMERMLQRLVGDSELFERYIWDQQFAHPGWSGIVSQIEDNPRSLFEHKRITLEEIINLELLLEMDYIYSLGDPQWAPLAHKLRFEEEPLFAPVIAAKHDLLRLAYQEAFEWTYYREVLSGLVKNAGIEKEIPAAGFQAYFCIDDRACSLRRHLELLDSRCETFGAPGFFGVEFYFLPEKGKFYSKLCPAPVQPHHLVREKGRRKQHRKDVHFSHRTHSLIGGWLISQTIGFLSAIRLGLQIFRPALTPATAASFRHMDHQADLEFEHHGKFTDDGLQIGFTIKEMADRVEALLRSTGHIRDFAPLVYMIGHGSTSTNNPHYAAYDCGACSGRPGSVNARVFAAMANHPEVRALLNEKGISIPDSTRFVGGMHDTTRDEIFWYDLEILPDAWTEVHHKNAAVFLKALQNNAVERSRRFELVGKERKFPEIEALVRRRSVSLFEPRPELNHATNALCIVGRRSLSRNVFFDRRAFLNSYDYRTDPEGHYLTGILKAVIPVCGGINLEYYFSRNDSARLGAGSKLPHNVVGLFGVANGIEGDLRTGLPTQMTEVHDPLRLLLVVEQFPEVLIKLLNENEAIGSWIRNEWIHLVAFHPENQICYRILNGQAVEVQLHPEKITQRAELLPAIVHEIENVPVFIISNAS